MRKEDNSPQGKIVTELLQHLHACKNNCDVFYGREEELEAMHKYIVGPSQKVRDEIRFFYWQKIYKHHLYSHLCYLGLEERGSLPCSASVLVSLSR